MLVVDDDADSRESLAMVLAEAGYEVIEARDGVQALRLLFNASPDVLMLDLMMPDLDGWTILKIKARDPQLRNVPVIITTGLTTQEVHSRGVEAALVIINKPLKPKQVLWALSRA